jgi:hypothetical protein
MKKSGKGWNAGRRTQLISLDCQVQTSDSTQVQGIQQTDCLFLDSRKGRNSENVFLVRVRVKISFVARKLRTLRDHSCLSLLEDYPQLQETLHGSIPSEGDFYNSEATKNCPVFDP